MSNYTGTFGGAEFGQGPTPPVFSSSTVPNATASTPGLIQLSGMLTGSATNPQVVDATPTTKGAIKLAQALSGTADAPTTPTDVATDGSVTTIVQMTQAAYNALATKDPNTVYVIQG